jgi:adenylate kinase
MRLPGVIGDLYSHPSSADSDTETSCRKINELEDWAFPPNMNRYVTYLIMGPPGSGKGTQGKALGTVPRFFHCACGDVFRALDTRTPLGQKFIEYSSRGELVPDDLTVELWHQSIDAQVVAARFKSDIDALVLDGIPRNLNQAKLMQDLIEVKQVFHLFCADRGELVRRLRKRALKDNRLDDANEVVIQQRLKTYEDETQPVLKYFGGIVTSIDAMQPPIKVMHDIVDAIWSKRDGSLSFSA